MAFLEVEGYAKNFGNSRVLKGISFSMEKGEVLAVIGSSGGGKTTLLRCLNFLETPDSGILKLDGEQFDVGNMHGICKESMRRLRLQFGMVFQHFNLFPQYTALENVALAKKLLCRQQLVDMKKQIAVQLKKESGLKKRQLNKLSANSTDSCVTTCSANGQSVPNSGLPVWECLTKKTATLTNCRADSNSVLPSRVH